MTCWNKSDIGKRIIYKDELLEDNEIIIYDIITQDTVRFVEYPLTINHESQLPMGLVSKIGMAGIAKRQKKENKTNLRYPGDWYFVDKVSKDQMRILEMLAKTPKKCL